MPILGLFDLTVVAIVVGARSSTLLNKTLVLGLWAVVIAVELGVTP